MAKQALTIADFKHRVSLCSMEDVVLADGGISLTRKDVYSCWAKIEQKKPSQFAPSGEAVNQMRSTQTHEIYVHYRRDFDISTTAWVYEERLQSAPRWYKIISVAEDDCAKFWCFKCRLVERSDDITPPVAEGANDGVASHVPLPQGIRL